MHGERMEEQLAHVNDTFFTSTKADMSLIKIVLFIVLVCYTVGGNCCNKKFTPISEYEGCKYIKRDFDQLAGTWHYVAERISEGAPSLHSGSLYVLDTTSNRFLSELHYRSWRGSTIIFPILGTYENDTTLRITGWERNLIHSVRVNRANSSFNFSVSVK
ncbi:hypothetical protein PV327_008852, partial [Microctonus hyperodae]